MWLTDPPKRMMCHCIASRLQDTPAPAASTTTAAKLTTNSQLSISPANSTTSKRFTNKGAPQTRPTRTITANLTATTNMSATELELQISPIVQESLMLNSKTLYNLQSLTASLFGVSAGILGLESYSGFLFYLAFSLLTAALFYTLRVAPTSLASGKSPLDTSRYFRGAMDFWTGGLMNGFAGFILTWTLFYGLVRA
ncbi:hypothetical protein BT67DRAFT_443704 [Trichocladium antarcticum]|uniref:ER membrane protein complex subunit 6 n=1 Tax=Trichocladium antarcticum TaxID=1450529 RepID=A0AAN6ZBT8_9PEZI|nr:hypothetical protein BT67DRAFT_443704 [Trichocladium antarcticum]